MHAKELRRARLTGPAACGKAAAAPRTFATGGACFASWPAASWPGAGLPAAAEGNPELAGRRHARGHGRCAQHGHANAQCRSPAVCVVTTCSLASFAPPARASRAGGSSGAPRDPVRTRRIRPRIGDCIPAGHLAVSRRARRPRLPSGVAPAPRAWPVAPAFRLVGCTAHDRRHRPGGAKPPLPAFRPAAEDDDERWRAISPPP